MILWALWLYLSADFLRLFRICTFKEVALTAVCLGWLALGAPWLAWPILVFHLTACLPGVATLVWIKCTRKAVTIVEHGEGKDLWEYVVGEKISS